MLTVNFCDPMLDHTANRSCTVHGKRKMARPVLDILALRRGLNVCTTYRPHYHFGRSRTSTRLRTDTHPFFVASDSSTIVSIALGPRPLKSFVGYAPYVPEAYSHVKSDCSREALIHKAYLDQTAAFLRPSSEDLKGFDS